MDSDVHLNSTRIRKMAALRRSAYRSRSYCLIAIIACLVIAADLIYYAIQRLRHHPTPIAILIAIAYFAAAIALLVLAAHFKRLAIKFHHESKKSILEDPATPPDFSQLQDGTQITKNLEDM
jgi:predicted PurR-regulated permease PerM